MKFFPIKAVTALSRVLRITYLSLRKMLEIILSHNYFYESNTAASTGKGLFLLKFLAININRESSQ